MSDEDDVPGTAELPTNEDISLVRFLGFALDHFKAEPDMIFRIRVFDATDNKVFTLLLGLGPDNIPHGKLNS